jgi:hypothetical protein
MSPFLRWLDKFLARAAKPFSKADLIETYARNGYWIFGGVLIISVFLMLLGFGFLQGISGAAPDVARPLLARMLAKIGADFLPPSLPLGFLMAFFFVIGGLFKKIQIPAGKFLASSAFRAMEAGVSAGEYCIEHRGTSAVLITVMIIILTWGFAHESEKGKREVLIRQNFDNWLAVSERFVEQNTVTSTQPNEYAIISRYWKDDFNTILSLPGGQKHPAYYLHQLMNKLYLEEHPGSFQDFLRNVTPELEKLSEECKKNLRPKDQMTVDEHRAMDLLNIQMGRIHNRLSEKKLSEVNPAERCIQCEADQAKALDYFSEVDLDFYKNLEAGRVYLSAVHNGKGTIYASIFTSALIWHQTVDTTKICGGDAVQCAVAALEEYAKAGEGFDTCSFHGLRKLNNTTDLLSKIAVTFDQVVDKNPTLQNQAWMANKESLAARLVSNVREMMACNAKGVFVAPAFLTSSQAYGAIATLLPQAASDYLVSAASYMRVAHSYEPGNLQDWELFYFCPALQEDKLDRGFIDGLAKQDGLQLSNLRILSNSIRKQCLRLTSH